MKRARGFVWALMLMGLAPMACAFLATPEVVTPSAASATPALNAPPTAALTSQASAQPSSAATGAPTQPPSAEAPTATPAASATPFPSSTATPAALALEMVQSQVWTDYQGNARANVVFRNPYDFPVQSGSVAQAVLRDAAGKIMRSGNLRFLDGLNVGGFLLPGETVAANTCFTCEEALLTQEWAAVQFFAPIKDATGQWEYSTAVEAQVASVDFEGNSPTFTGSGTVTNNSDQPWQVIGVRIIVFDQDGRLMGALEATASNVAPGATARFSGYGIGQTPADGFTYQVGALGLNY